MRTLLIAAAAVTAAIALPAAPVQAEHQDGPLVGKASSSIGDSRCDARDRDRSRRDGRRDRRDSRANCGVFVSGWYGGEWALYNNRSWEPDSYNDWWHDRPDRAYPRWVRESRGSGSCAPDRMWWSGSGWHC